MGLPRPWHRTGWSSSWLILSPPSNPRKWRGMKIRSYERANSLEHGRFYFNASFIPTVFENGPNLCRQNFKGHHSSFSIATEAVKALIFLPFSSVFFCHFESSLAHYVSFEMINTSKTGPETTLCLASIASEVSGRGKRLCTECEGWPPAPSPQPPLISWEKTNIWEQLICWALSILITEFWAVCFVIMPPGTDNDGGTHWWGKPKNVMSMT